MYPNVTFIHDNGVTSVDREVRDYTAHLKETAVAPGYGRKQRAARTHTEYGPHSNEPGEPIRGWHYIGPKWRNHLAQTNLGVNFAPADRQYRKLVRPQLFAAIYNRTGVKPKNAQEAAEIMAQLPPGEQNDIDTFFDQMVSADVYQGKAAREPARPFEPTHANRVTNWEKRNPGRDKALDPLGNPNEQQRIALEQSARFLPAELLHMVRPDRRPEPPLDQHPGYNSIPARTIRDRNSAAVPANYVHH